MGPTRPACSGRIGAWLLPRRQRNVQQLTAKGATVGEGSKGEGVSHLAPSRAGSRGRGGPCARRTCACPAGYRRCAGRARPPAFGGRGGGDHSPSTAASLAASASRSGSVAPRATCARGKRHRKWLKRHRVPSGSAGRGCGLKNRHGPFRGRGRRGHEGTRARGHEGTREGVTHTSRVPAIGAGSTWRSAASRNEHACARARAAAVSGQR